MTHEIGGYFGLDLNEYNNFPYPDGVMLQSARVGLVHFLRSVSYRRVFMPVYCCPTIEAILAYSDISTVPYHLKNNFWPDIDFDDLGADDYVFFVNYYGICDNVIARLLDKGVNLIVDNSQCLFKSYDAAACTLFSPKKFAGLPDGGVLLSKRKEVEEPDGQDQTSINRISHLLLRVSEGAEAGYKDFKSNMATLSEQSPKAMSALTRRLIKHVDWGACKEKRTQNFLYLHSTLKRFNVLNLKEGVEGAFCYPLYMPDVDVANIRKKLIEKRIFVPIYWPGLAPDTLSQWEQSILEKTLALPMDQRHSTDDLDFVLETILRIIK